MRGLKVDPSMVSRFDGKNGRTRLVDALLRQNLVSGDVALARRIAASTELIEVKPGKEITKQGGNDNDLYFILSGTVSILVNGRTVASRTVGEQVGEMALVDSTARRTATVVAVESCALAKVTETQFSRIARVHTDLWHRVAVTLADRLRERGKFHQAPRSQPVVFIGSSFEGSKIADSIYNYLLRFQVIPKLWSEGVFEASKTAIEDLVKLSLGSDFAIIILTPDDVTKSRGKKKASPRDNAIFELGMFYGALGRDRTYFVIPRGIDIKIPTDLLGVTRLEYRPRGPKSLSRRLRSVKTQIHRLITKYGPR